MRILHLDSGREWRGGQQQLLLLLTFLREKGHEVAAACRAGSPLHDRLRAASIACLPWPVPGPGGFLRRLDQDVREFRPDIIPSHDARSILPALWAGKPRRIQVVAHRRVDFPIGRLAALVKYRPLAAVIAVSAKIKEILAGRGVHGSRILVVPDGIDLERFARAQTPPGPDLHVGRAGSLVDHKGHIHLVEADRFRLRGFVADMPSFYRSLDIYAHPSNLEGMGSAIIEAMASGLPVVAAASGGIPEVVGGHGVLVAPADPGALAAGLKALLESPQERARLAARSLARSRQFDFRLTNAPLIGLYQRLAAGGKGFRA